MQFRAESASRGRVELVLDYAQQSLVEFQEGVDFVFVRAAHIPQLFQLFLAGQTQVFQFFIFLFELLVTHKFSNS